MGTPFELTYLVINELQSKSIHADLALFSRRKELSNGKYWPAVVITKKDGDSYKLFVIDLYTSLGFLEKLKIFSPMLPVKEYMKMGNYDCVLIIKDFPGNVNKSFKDLIKDKSAYVFYEQ